MDETYIHWTAYTYCLWKNAYFAKLSTYFFRFCCFSLYEINLCPFYSLMSKNVCTIDLSLKAFGFIDVLYWKFRSPFCGVETVLHRLVQPVSCVGSSNSFLVFSGICYFQLWWRHWGHTFHSDMEFSPY